MKTAFNEVKIFDLRLKSALISYKEILVLFICVFLFSTPIYSQDMEVNESTVLKSEAPSLRFEHTSIQEGMAQATANHMMQDSEGYLWIASQGGLHRYDGYEFKIYKETSFDTTSLSENWVWGTSESQDGGIWVATEGGGLNKLNKATGHFTKYVHDPNDSTSISSNRTFYPFEDSRGDLWLSTLNNGLNRMKKGEDGVFTRFIHVHEDTSTLTTNVLFWITEDSDGYIWVASTNGLNRIDPSTDEVKRFLYDPEAGENYGNPNNVIDQYHSPSDPNIIWLPTGNGLVKFNKRTESYNRYLIAPNEGTTINPLNFIHQVVPDPDQSNILWVGGPGTGVARFDMQTETFTSYRKDPRDPNSLVDNNVQSLLADRTGTIWVGTAAEGMSSFNPGAVNFTHLKHDPEDDQSISGGIVWGVYQDRHENLWIGSDAGAAGHTLTKFDINDGSTQKYSFNPDDSTTLLFGSYRVFAEDDLGQFWVGGGGGLNLFDRPSGKALRVRHPRKPENRGRNVIFALIPKADEPNTFWVGSAGGVDIFNSRTHEFEHVYVATGDMETEPVVLSLTEDTNGLLWVGTNQGLLRVDQEYQSTIASQYDPNNRTTINHNQITSVLERAAEPGILWLGTQNGGINRFDTKTGKAIHFNTDKGLPSNTLYGILEDEEGTLWMSTNNGISNFNPETESFRNYGLDDGLMALEYSQNAYFKSQNGVLYFGSGKGVTAFIPEQLHINEVPPQVTIAGLKLFNEEVEIGPDSPIKKPLSEEQLIQLPYNQNEITFDYVGIHYANPKKNQYSYQLTGFDKQWIDAGSKRSATYTNLPPGDYTFKVKAANADGVWNEQGASLAFSILPPWYQTYWAYGLFICMFGFLVVGVDRVQRIRLSKKERERSALREAELKAEAENQRRSDTEQLSKIGRTITSSLSLDEIIETVYENVNALMDAAIFGVGIYNEDHNRLDFPATKENGEMLPSYVNNLDEENRLAVQCFKKNEAIVLGDFENEHSKYIKKYQPPIVGEEPCSLIYLPLVHQERVIGVITTQSFNKQAYTEYHVNLLRNLATYAAIAIDNASAYRKLNSTLRELQSMQQQLVQQEKLASLGQLTAGIAHEIKNPLNFVNNFSELSMEMIDEARDELIQLGTDHNIPVESLQEVLDSIEGNLKKVHEHGSRADSIVKSMLLHSRGGSGKSVPTDINALLKEYVNLSFHGMRAGKNPISVDLQFDLDEEAGTPSLIAEDFSRVIVNVCNNAFDAMRNKLSESKKGSADYRPELKIRTHRNSSGLSIHISDNGPGIPKEIREQVLQPFFTTKKGTEGTGLGLSISNDIIKAHGGELMLDSDTGEGTRFTIQFPNNSQF